MPSRYADFAADPALVDRTVDAAFEEARAARALATYARSLAGGTDTDTAFIATVRALLDAGLPDVASGLATGGAIPAPVQALARALVHLDDGRVEAAWAELAGVEPALLARHAPVEAVDCALRVRTSAAADAARGIVADLAPLDSPTVARLAGSFVAFGEVPTARGLVDELDRREGVDARLDGGADDDLALVTANLRRWTHPQPRTTAPAGAVRIGVIDYYQPDLGRASRNVGDYVQTLAMLGHLARFQGVRFTGDDGLGELAASLQPRVRPALRLDGPQGEVHLTPVSRDFSEGDDLAPDTWMVAFGWHLWPMWKLRFGFPYHPHLNPIFVSFHVQHVEALTPEAVDYLRQHGPIGCRDWTTVDLLLSAGVDAFFTGCVTTTLSTVFPETGGDRPGADVVAAVDIPAGKVKANRPVEEATNVADKWRHMGLADGVRDAIGLLEDYQQRYHRIVTSRLHAYLPATSLGIPVTFRPKRLGDVRFDGLLDMTPDGDAFTTIRDGILTLLADVLGLVLAGADRASVQDRWRALTADRVEEARKRLHAPAEVPAPPVDVPALAQQVTRRAAGPAPATDATSVSLAVQPGREHRLVGEVARLLDAVDGPVHLHVVARGLDPAVHDDLGAAHPDLPVSFLDFDRVVHDGELLGHTTPAALDLLLLPVVLPDVDRLVHVDDARPSDVTAVAAARLDGAPLAARGTDEPLAKTWRRAGDLLPPDRAAELRRSMAASHPLETRAFDTSVVALDLARLRADRFTERFLPVATAFGLDLGEALAAYAGSDHRRIDDE